MKQLHVTLGSGDTHVVDLQPTSMLVVRTRKATAVGVVEDVEDAWSDVTDVQVVEVEAPDTTGPVILQESPYLSSPDTVVQYAMTAPPGDAATLVDQAKERYGEDHPEVVKAAQIVADRIGEINDSVEQPEPPSTTLPGESEQPVEPQPEQVETTVGGVQTAVPAGEADVTTPGTAAPAADEPSADAQPPAEPPADSQPAADAAPDTAAAPADQPDA